jgi:hypothetical protein
VQEDSSDPEYDDGIADSIPSEPPEFSSRLSRISRATAEYDDGTADPIPSEPSRLGSCISRVSCPVEGTMDPLDGENTSGQVKSRSESSRLDERVSSSADDIFLDYHDVVVTDDNYIFLDDHDDVVTGDTIATEPLDGLGSRVSSSADDLFECDDGITDLIPTEPAGIADSIPSEPPELRSRLSRVSHATDEYDDGIADSIPSKPPELRSRLSATVSQDSWGAAQEDPSGQVKPRSELRSSAEHDDGIADSTYRATDNSLGAAQEDSSEPECEDGIADSIPSEPPDEIRSRLSAMVCQNSWGASVQEDSFSPRANAQVRILVW